MRTKSSNDQHTLKLEQIYQFKVLVPESAMSALADACDLHSVQAHRGLLPINDEKDYEVLLQISATSRESALFIAFITGTFYASKIKSK